jgi:hypothetical protein
MAPRTFASRCSSRPRLLARASSRLAVTLIAPGVPHHPEEGVQRRDGRGGHGPAVAPAPLPGAVARRRGRASCSAGSCSKTSRTAAATATGQTRWRNGGGGGARAPGRSRLRVGRNRRQGTAPGQGRHSVPGLDRAWQALRKAPRTRPPACGSTREPPSYYLRSAHQAFEVPGVTNRHRHVRPAVRRIGVVDG